MKTYQITLTALCLLLSSCITVSYFGDKLTPTSNVDIYYSSHDVTKPYKVIGHLTCNNFTQQQVKEKLTEYAKKVGADAIVITGTDHIKDDQAGLVNADALKYK